MFRLRDNPVFRREFGVNTRSVKTLLAALALVGILSLLLILLWPRSGVFSKTNSNEIFSVFLNINLALVVLLIPGFVATTISSERENRSFEMLFTSLLTPPEIMFGKLCSALSVTFLVVLISMPVTAICALSGGISVPLLIRAYTVVLLATLTYGLFGLAISSLCHRSFTSLVLTYVGLMVLAGGTWLPSVLLASQMPSFQPLFQALRSLSPFEALLALNHPERYELAVVGTTAQGVFRFYVSGMLVLQLLCFATFCYFLLRPVERQTDRGQKQYTDLRTTLQRKMMFPFYLIDPLQRKKPIPFYRNPVFVAELRSRIFGNPKFIVRSLAACIALSLVVLKLVALQYESQVSSDGVRLVAIIFQVGVVAFFAPAVCSGSITDERISGTLTMLRMTGVRSHTVVFGKFKAGFMYVLIFLVSSLPVLGSLYYLEPSPASWRFSAWLGILILTTLLFVVAGLAASGLAKTTGQATAISYAFSAVLCLAPLGTLLFGTRVTPELQTLILTTNPVAAALQVTSDSLFADLPRLWGRRLWHNHLIFAGSLIALLTLATAIRVRHIFNHRT